MTTDEILQTRLRLRDDVASPEWRVWEHKTFNVHRGVLHWRPAGPAWTFGRGSEAIRDRVKSCFRRSWWRGFGFGVLIESGAIPEDVAAIEASIDTRASGEGTWQWTLLACEAARLAVGVHTWAEGYLSPVYRSLLGRYENLGLTVGGFRKEKDRLMQFLTAASRLKGFKVTEFEP